MESDERDSVSGDARDMPLDQFSAVGIFLIKEINVLLHASSGSGGLGGRVF
jgi:hypothetical protein